MGCSRAGPLAYAVTAFVTFAVSVVTLLFYIFSWWEIKGITLFDNARYNFWRSVGLSLIDSRIQAAGWLFVLTFQMFGTAFAFAASYRHNAMCGAIRGAMSPAVQFLLLLSNCGIIAWMFVLDQTSHVKYAIIGLIVSTICSYIAMWNFHGTFEEIHCDVTSSTKCDYVSAQLLINGGLGFSTSWVMCIVFNHVIILIYMYTNLKMEYVVYINIGVLFLYASVWFCTDIFYFRRRTTFAFSPYLSCIVAGAAILWEGFKMHVPMLTTILTAVILGLIVLMVITKALINCVNACRKSGDSKSGHVKAKGFSIDTYC